MATGHLRSGVRGAGSSSDLRPDPCSVRVHPVDPVFTRSALNPTGAVYVVVDPDFNTNNPVSPSAPTCMTDPSGFADTFTSAPTRIRHPVPGKPSS